MARPVDAPPVDCAMMLDVVYFVEEHRLGVVYDSSTGFRLSDKVLLIRPGRLDAVLDELRKMGHTPQVVSK